MTDVTVSFPVVFGPQRDRPRKHVKIVTPATAPRAPNRRRAGHAAGDAPDPEAPLPAATDAPTSRTARSLALATLIQRKIDAGQIRDHAHAAELLGITRPNVAYIMNLLNLAADIQEALIMGELVVSERSLRPVARMLLWSDQVKTLQPCQTGPNREGLCTSRDGTCEQDDR